MKNILIEFNDPYFRDVAIALIKEGVKIDYILTSFPKLYSGYPEFKKTHITDENQFFLIDNIAKLNKDNKNSLDEKFIKENYDLEGLFLKITDRLCFYPKTVKIRQYVYYELLLYWKTFFEENNIKTIIFPRIPHLGYGNIIFHLAKKFGINVWIIKDTFLDNKILIESDFNKKAKVPTNYLEKETLAQLEEKLSDELLSQINISSKLMNLNYSDNKKVILQNKINLANHLVKIENYKNLFKVLSNNPFKRSIQSFLYLEKPTTWFYFYFMLFKYYLKSKRLLKFYKSLTQVANFSSKYVYFPLHYQPERTSLPEGGIYENLLLIVDTIAKSLPKDWHLYIKEHPYQFSRSDARLYNFRSKLFYSKIASYNQVKLLPVDTPTTKLIENCQFVVTVTGSTGWEALLTEIPVMLFGYSAWYSPCNSCFNVSSLKECKESIIKIKSLDKRQVQKDLLRFLIYYKDKFIKSNALYELVKNDQRTYQESVSNLAKTLNNKIIKKLSAQAL